MKRPIGLILSAIVLSLIALLLLLLAALMAFSGILAAHQPTLAASPHFILYLMLAVSVFYAVLTVWAILTVIGILRLRRWGRYSILIIGGGLAAFNLFAIVFTIFSRTLLSGLAPHQPAADPHITFVVTVFMVVLYLLFAAVGIWWLIYFNLRSTRALFNSESSSFSVDSTLSGPYGYVPPAKHSNGLFSSPSQTPAAIKIIAWLMLIGAVLCLPLSFLPVPAFILGFILPVGASHVLFIVILAIAASIGYGLLKLRSSARLAAIAFICFGFVNSAISLLPWYQNQFRQYTAQLTEKFTSMLPAIPGHPAVAYNDPTKMIVFNSLVAVAINLYVLWLLYRHRTAFNPPPPLPD